MNYLVSLPIIERIKKEAERYRSVLNADVLKEKEEQKAKIMEQFGHYMEAEMRGNPKVSIRRRIKTVT